jgi:hypothetical protein
MRILQNEKKQSSSFNLLRIWVLVCAVIILFLHAPSLKAEVMIYFYNPDANLRDVAQLKSQVQEYFQSIDPNASLKAFLRLQDLLNALKSQPPDFLVASSWVIKSYGASFGFKPLLVGQGAGGKSYYKVLISKKGLPESSSPSLSMVGLGESNAAGLKALVPELKKYSNINVVEVSKDIDAVFAVSFDQVDMALVHPQNIEAVRKANQSAVSEVKILAKSMPIEYPIFSSTPKASSSVVDKFVKGLQSSKDGKSIQALNLMGFAGWGAP